MARGGARPGAGRPARKSANTSPPYDACARPRARRDTVDPHQKTMMVQSLGEKYGAAAIEVGDNKSGIGSQPTISISRITAGRVVSTAPTTAIDFGGTSPGPRVTGAVALSLTWAGSADRHKQGKLTASPIRDGGNLQSPASGPNARLCEVQRRCGGREVGGWHRGRNPVTRSPRPSSVSVSARSLPASRFD
jgi:hypothetical protein